MAELKPDSLLVQHVHPSPNHGERRGREAPDALVLHYTGMKDGPSALRQLCNPLAEVSAHYFVEEDGRILQLVPELRRAWHAGRGCWQGETDMNSASIGIEIVNPGHEHGYRAFPPAQIDAVAALAADIVRRWRIRPDRVIAHSDMAPERKEDPGELFPWEALAAQGAGLWVAPAALGGGRFLQQGDGGAPVEALQRMLGLHGYDCPPTALFDPRTAAVVRAFQRHFRPTRVDGVADMSTVETLRRVLHARPAPFEAT